MDEFVENKTIIAGKLIKISRSSLTICFEGKMGFCHISEVSDYLVKDLRELFSLYEYYDFIITKALPYDEYELSFKRIHPKFLKWHHDIIETPLTDTNLKQDLSNRLKKMHF